MCCLKLHKYEQSMADISQALERSKNSDIKPDIMIKLRYRLALSLTHLRDYEQALHILKHLKKYCNTYNELGMFRDCQRLEDKVSELANQQMKGKYRGVSFAGVPGHVPGPGFDYLEECSNVHANVNDYVSEKLAIKEFPGQGRGVYATRPIKQGELLMVAQAVACAVQ
jgi:tetratricopeptide (TPR) repeat protein